MRNKLTTWFTKRSCFLFCIPLLLLIIFYLFLHNAPKYSEPKHISIAETLLEVPQKFMVAKSSIKPYVSFIGVEVNGKKVLTKVMDARPLRQWRQVFLFLHGMAFTSETWMKLESLQLVAALGHRAIAVDLPGWGESGEKPSEGDVGNSEYLEALLRSLNVSKPIIVTPSMSGSYSIPFMMQPSPGSCSDRLAGMIAVAPINTDLFEHAEYFRCQIPVMIVYGSKDKHIGLQAVSNLRNMPSKEIWEVKGAGHPAYLDKPEEWNKLLYHYCTNFIK